MPLLQCLHMYVYTEGLFHNDPQRLCLALLKLMAEASYDCMSILLFQDQGFFLELEFLQAEVMVKSLGLKQEAFSKNVVDVRLNAIKRCEEAVVNAVRLGNAQVLQAGCVTQWNLCLPMLQPNLRHHVRRPLTVVADALHGIHR